MHSPHFKVAELSTNIFKNRQFVEDFFAEKADSSELTKRINDRKEVLLEAFVGTLRKNRTHWHPLVQKLSTSLLDFVFDLMT